MAKEDNLITPQELNARLTPEQRKANATKAGKASGKARNLQARLKEWAENGGYDKMLAMAEAEIAAGNTKMWELIRDTIGEKPSEKVDLFIDDESTREIDEYLAGKYNNPARK